MDESRRAPERRREMSRGKADDMEGVSDMDSSNIACLRRRLSRRRRARSDVLRSSGSQTNITDAATVGFRAAPNFEQMDTVDEVLQFLRELGLGQYVESFRKNAVTGDIMLSLNSAELRKTLGVKNIAHRRAILDGISFLRQKVGIESKIVLPEDGRILNHLANERTVLAWLRLAVIMQTAAVAIVRFTHLDTLSNKTSVAYSSIFIASVAFIVSVWTVYRYFLMMKMIETAGWDVSPENAKIFTPAVAICAIAVISVYFTMAHDSEEGGVILMLCI